MNTRPVFLGLALLATVLAAVITLEFDRDQPAADATGIVPTRRVMKAQPRVASEDPEDHTDAWVATALGRPLFSRDRKPTPVEAKAGGGETLTSLPRLTGVVIGSFGRTAIFAGAENGKPISLGVGKTIGPYTVETIEPGQVTVSGPEGERTVELKADAASRQALAADIPQPPPTQPAQPPGVQPGTLPGMQAGGPGRPNMLNLRPGVQFQRGLPQSMQPQKPAQEGTE